MSEILGWVKTSEREDYWRDIVKRQKKSGLSVRAFCGPESLCRHTLYAWRQRFAKSAAVGFAEIQIASPAPSAALEVHLPSGDRLQIAAGVDATTLRTVLAILREQA